MNGRDPGDICLAHSRIYANVVRRILLAEIVLESFEKLIAVQLDVELSLINSAQALRIRVIKASSIHRPDPTFPWSFMDFGQKSAKVRLQSRKDISFNILKKP